MSILKLQSNLFCDTLLLDKNNNLIFMSIYGRETGMLELFGKLTIGLNTLKFDDSYHFAKFSKDLNYEKKTLKFNTSQYGTMIHSWIFDSRIKYPDFDSKTALLLHKDGSDQNLTERYISIIKEISSLPILDHWASDIVSIVKNNEMISSFKPIVGSVSASLITINDKLLTNLMSDLIKSGVLSIKNKKEVL